MRSERPTVEIPARCPKGAVERGRQPSCGRGAVLDGEPQRPGTPGRGKGSGPRDPDREGRLRPGGGLDGRHDGRDPLICGRPEEAEGQVQPIQTNPADASTLGFARPNGLDDLFHGRPCSLVERERDEESRIRDQPRGTGSAPWASDRHVARSSTRTLRAASASRQPTTSVSFASSSLYVLKKCSISTRRCGRT